MRFGSTGGAFGSTIPSGPGGGLAVRPRGRALVLGVDYDSLGFGAEPREGIPPGAHHTDPDEVSTANWVGSPFAVGTLRLDLV